MTRRVKQLPSRRIYASRIGRAAALSGTLVFFSLGIGTLGYHAFGGLSWLDAEYNAAMILTGMGPVDPMHTTTSKVFASAYALFSGVAFLSSVGVLVAPFVHRFLHQFHLELEADP